MHLTRPFGKHSIIHYQTRDKLRTLRKRRGYSLARLARLMGITARTLEHWENGKTTPQTEYALRAWAAWVGAKVNITINITLDPLPDPRGPPSESKLAQRRVAASRARGANGQFIVSGAGESGEKH